MIDKSKKELVSLAYVLTLQNSLLVLSKTKQQVTAKQNYESLLQIDVDGINITIPDPIKLASNWKCEKDAASISMFIDGHK